MADKVLFSATVDGHIEAFHLPYLKYFHDNGFEVHVASKGNKQIPWVDRKYDIPFERFPFKPNNLKAFLMLKKIIDENHYRLIHCHTPVGSVLTRFAARDARKRGTKVIYTAHGFHFYHQAPLINNLLYKKMEILAAKYTDLLITINQEDYEAAQRLQLQKDGKIYFVPGVGVDVEKYQNITVDRAQKRAEFGIPEQALVFIAVGELIHRKNHVQAITAFAEFAKQVTRDTRLIICGEGPLKSKLQQLAVDLGVADRVCLAGFRRDISQLLKACDIFLFLSFQEGLPVAVMEAMAAGLPVIATRIRGNVDLLGGVTENCLVAVNDVAATVTLMHKLAANPEFCKQVVSEQHQQIRKYDLEAVLGEVTVLYQTILGAKV
ncbi:MAG TPA: glycosyltransferase family 4 protein [Bacillota bacterium]|nr:glycosyltransferase family 4 protein [Bacillota bacterium]HOL08769.1 glycosyltransferase family 4 protein [Bacillota bacterium]HPO96328.1 glycosyltransferase family 4 protein [Bacillota bacterium]